MPPENVDPIQDIGAQMEDTANGISAGDAVAAVENVPDTAPAAPEADPVAPEAPAPDAAPAPEAPPVDNDSGFDKLVAALGEIVKAAPEAKPKEDPKKDEAPKYDPTAFAGKPETKPETAGEGKENQVSDPKAAEEIAKAAKAAEELQKKYAELETEHGESNQLWESALKDPVTSLFLNKFLEDTANGKKSEIDPNGLRVISAILSGKKIDFDAVLREKAKDELAALPATSPSSPAAKPAEEEEGYSDTLAKALPGGSWGR